MKTSIWVEKYRPTSVKDVIFQDERQQKQFETFVANGDIPHLFISGIQGTGKSSVSLALIRDLKIDRADVIKINCSKDKIDAMRNKVDAFAMTMPIGKFKIVRLEEIDYLSLDAQALLRGLIEETSATCRYIATCNYENKVIPPLKDRFQRFNFKAPDKEKIALHVVNILDKEEIEFEPEHVLTYIDVGYPSVRNILQLLQQNSVEGKLYDPRNASSTDADWKFGLIDAITKGDLKKARKLVCESATREEHEEVYRFMYDNIEKLKVSDKEAAIVTIAEYLFKHGVVADTEINLAAMFIELSKL